MATTKIWPIHAGRDIKVVLDYVTDERKTDVTHVKMRLDINHKREYSKSEIDNMIDVMEYVMDDYKTEEKKLISGINVSVEHAREEMMTTKMHYHKEDKIILWHGYQSFKPGEVTPEEAHLIGCELARNLWGDDYEIIVSTHIDKEHIHNHFVINSVSFRTGRKLDGKWGDMKRESDRLCKLHGKSVIVNPEYKGKHYAEYQAEKSGEHTWRSLIKNELDDIIAQSDSIVSFFKELEARGWTYKVGKFFTVKPPGKDYGMKIDRHLGNKYSIEGIEKRIHNNTVRAKLPNHKIYRCVNRVARPTKTIKGYQALYFFYCYKLGVLPKRNASSRRIQYIYKEELRNIDKISNETRFLAKYKITTAGDLELKKTELKNMLYSLVKKRQSFYNNIRNSDSEYWKREVSIINEKIKECRKELFYCNDVAKRSEVLKDKVERWKHVERENKDKEVE